MGNNALWRFNMKLSLTAQYLIAAAVALFLAVMLHISSPEQCNIKGECISIDFNYKPQIP